MAGKNSLRRNTAFDLTQTKFIAPQTRLEANRWLSFATFGAATPETDISASTKSSIVPLSGAVDDATTLMSQGYATWLAAQLTDNTIPELTVNVESMNFGEITGNGRSGGLFAWFYGYALHGSAQVRFKLAYALSQIFVVNGTGNDRFVYDKYYELFIKATLSTNTSSFRQLMEDVTYSPAMMTMLTYDNNRREDLALNAHPDQNYAREILQLFTIGLEQLNLDGTPILDANGNPVPTYAPQDIDQIARIFTGFERDGGTSRIAEISTFGVNGWNTYHEVGSKVLFPYYGQSSVTFPAIPDTWSVEYPPNNSGYVISGVTTNTFTITITNPVQNNKTGKPILYGLTNVRTGTKVAATADMLSGNTSVTITANGHGLSNGTRVYIYGAAQESIRFFLDYLFNHPNVGPFIATALIKLMVCSNPSTDYVKRVATVFNDNGNGVRGDLSSVCKAILLDRECIIPYGINQNNFGKYTTVMDRYLRVGRAFRNDMVHFINRDPYGKLENIQDPSNRQYPNATKPWYTKPRDLLEYGGCGIYYSGTVGPMQSNSVFNFFRPGYVPPSSVIGSLNKTLPEVQINTINTQLLWANSIASLCETEYSTDVQYGADATDPGSPFLIWNGFDIVPDVNGFTINSVTNNGNNNYTISVTGVVTTDWAGGNNDGGYGFYMKNRTRGSSYVGHYTTSRPTGTGSKTFSISIYDTGSFAAPQTGDILDMSQLGILGYSGFPNLTFYDGGGGINKRYAYPMHILFNKPASLLPDTASVPTLSQCNAVIDYLESVLMTRPISAAGRALMVQAGQQVVSGYTPKSGFAITGQDNAYLNIQIGYAQKRVRLMTGILLALPEFSSLR